MQSWVKWVVGGLVFLGVCVVLAATIVAVGIARLGDRSTTAMGKPTAERLKASLVDSKWKATATESREKGVEMKKSLTVGLKADGTFSYDIDVTPAIIGPFLQTSGRYTVNDNVIVLTVTAGTGVNAPPEGSTIDLRVLTLNESQMKVAAEKSQFAESFTLDRVR